MSYDDPYAAGSDVPPPSEMSTIRSRLMAPGIFMIVVAVLNLLGACVLGFSALSNRQLTPEQLEQQMQAQFPKQLADLKAAGWSVEQIQNATFVGYTIWATVDFFASLLIILGSIRMMALKSYGFAVFTSVLAAIPIVSCSSCCLIGEVAGIWALVVLLNNEVRAAFQ